MRTNYLPFALPDIDHTELDQIRDALESGWITTGPKTKQFEEEFSAFVGAKHAVAVNSCTAAMHLALDAIGLKAGDEVITTPYTFAATAEVIQYFQAVPVFVDIRQADFNIDPDLIEQALTPRTRAILPVHIAGLSADLDAIYAIAKKYDLAVIEDAAHAFPAKYKNRTVGNASTGSHSAVCFSFYATKTMTTGEGGMICTNDDTLAEQCRFMSLHGISKDAWKRYTAEGSWYYEILAPGYKYNMTDIAAGMGLAQLAKGEGMWEKRRKIAGKYNRIFLKFPELQTPFDPEHQLSCYDNGCMGQGASVNSQHAWHLYMLRLNTAQLSIDRASFMKELKCRNIGASVHFIPLHIHPYYKDTYGYQPEDYPVALREYSREISLPIFSKMNDQDVEDVIDATIDIVRKHRV